MIIFLFWLSLSSISITGLLPAGVAIILCGVASVFIKQPFGLTVSDAGLAIRSPGKDSFVAWEDFQQFAIRRADPWTTYIVYKLKGEEKKSRFDGRLFPYFELDNEELLQLLRQYQYKGRTHLII